MLLDPRKSSCCLWSLINTNANHMKQTDWLSPAAWYSCGSMTWRIWSAHLYNQFTSSWRAIHKSHYLASYSSILIVGFTVEGHTDGSSYMSFSLLFLLFSAIWELYFQIWVNKMGSALTEYPVPLGWSLVNKSSSECRTQWHEMQSFPQENIYFCKSGLMVAMSVISQCGSMWPVVWVFLDYAALWRNTINF